MHPVTVDPRTTGPDRTPTVPSALAATRASGFSWSGKTLRFTVDPKGVPVVYVNFYDKDLGYDYDRDGNQRSGLRDTDEFLAGYAVRPQTRRHGVGQGHRRGRRPVGLVRRRLLRTHAETGADRTIRHTAALVTSAVIDGGYVHSDDDQLPGRRRRGHTHRDGVQEQPPRRAHQAR